jgi:sarcosine oxidase, subunit gamma
MLKRVFAPRGIIRIQTWDSEAIAPAAIEDLLGVAWPQNTGIVAAGRVEIICVGPSEWLVIAADPDPISWLQRLDVACKDSSFRVTNVSQALARIEIEGPEARNLLAKGCALDLRPSRFAPGRSARTRFAGMPVIVQCRGVSKFECIVTRSYADYLLSWFADATLEFESTTSRHLATTP